MRSDELTSFRYRAPVNSPIPDLWEPRSAGEDLSEALSTILAHFSRTSNDATAVLIHREAEDDSYDSALFFTIDPGHIHVVGLSPLAAQVRRLLSDGFNGWHLHALPPTRTPLHTVRGRLASRFYNVLERNGFASLEEIAAVPPAGWREINHVGPRFLQALDTVMPATIDRGAWAAGWKERFEQLLADLTPGARLRYRYFAEILARSPIPATALERIVDALNAEPLPPPDPIVPLLLSTASQEDLVTLYNDTHA